MKCLHRKDSPDYYVFMTTNEIEEFKKIGILKGFIYREYIMFYKTLKQIYLVFLPESIHGDTLWIYEKREVLDLFGIPEFIINHFLNNTDGFHKGYEEYRYNMVGDKICFYNTDIDDCRLVERFMDEESHTTYDILKKRIPKLEGLPKINY